MKAIHYISSILFLALMYSSSCQRPELDLIFGDPNERIFETLKDYQSVLVNAPNGWKTVFSPVGGGTFSFYMQFTDDNRVDMLSDINATTAAEVRNSSYVLKSVQQPNLIFDTYNYLHILSHPLNSISGGSGGQGRMSDFEFHFESVSADSIVLRGVRNNNKMVLEPATVEEAAFYRSGGINAFVERVGSYIDGKLFQISEGGAQSPIYINANNRSVTMYEIDGDQVGITSSGFTFTPEGLNLVSPITFRGNQYSTVYWDEDIQGFYLLNDDTRLYIDDTLTSPYLLPYTPRLQDVIGTSGYNILSIRTDNNIPQVGTFKTWLDNDLGRIAAGNRSLNYAAFDFSNINADLDNPAVTHNFEIRVRTGPPYYTAIFRYKFRWVDREEGMFELEYVDANTSNSFTLGYSQDLRQITGHRLKLAYFAIPGPSGARIVGLQSLDDLSVYCYSILSDSV